ncbi:MAG TPA: HD domain-containing protein [Sedimentisphaerales bacterium]|nr:HD domain-containing protein [Sedimentisphaerales bacterium]
MEQKQLDKFRVWFDNYVAGFYGDDDVNNANLKLKEEHSRRVCREMLYLAEELGLEENQKRLSETIALFHDIGRFEQFVKYRTYSDVKSVDHCRLGLKVLQQAEVLDGIEQEEKKLVEKAIEYHGRKELPDDLNGQCLLFSKLIRDADKIDALFVVTGYYEQYRENPKDFKIDLELPDEPGYSAEVVRGLLKGQPIDYRRLRTLNDLMLCLLGWIYDVNFTPTLERIKQRKYLEKLLGFLPDTEDIERVKEKIFGYVNLRIERNGK